jgi:hypothetical protein
VQISGAGSQNSFSSPTSYSKIVGIGTQYNGAQAYGQRIAAQMSNPNYNRNVIVAGLQNLVNSLQQLIASLTPTVSAKK